MTYNILSHTNLKIFPTALHQSILETLGTMNVSQTNHLVKSTELITIGNELSYNESVGKLGIFPPGIGKVFKLFNCLNQKYIWMFRKVLYRYKLRIMDKPLYIANTEDLIGDNINYKSKSRRILKLWDNQSSRYYCFTINDIIGVFKSSLISDDNPVHPKNPYTNLEFTIGQIVEIYKFLQSNRDRIPICYSSIIAYCKWNKSLRIIHNYNTLFYYQLGPCQSIHCDERDEKIHETILLDSLFIKRRCDIKKDKQELYEEMRKIFLYLILNETYSIDNIIPDTKMGYFVLDTYLKYGGIRTLGILNKWLESNSYKYIVKYKSNKIIASENNTRTNENNIGDESIINESDNTDDVTSDTLSYQFKRMRLT